MKKLMLTATIVCAAAMAQAAACDWSFEADGDMGEMAVSQTATYYLINGSATAGATLATLLTTENTDGAKAFLSGLTSYGSMNGALEGGIASDSFQPTTDNYMTIFIFNDGVVGGKDFAYNVYDATENIYSGTESVPSLGMYASDWGDKDYAYAWGSGTIATAAVPEPTSGLLLLLGVAGLALKRKRA